MSVSSCATTREPLRPASAPRAGHIASISSSRITHGVPSAHFASASRKASRRRASASPAYGPKTSPAFSDTTVAPASRATATAEAVFPTPGGPCRSTPRGNLAPRASASAAYSVGQTTHSRNARSASSAPAMRSEAEGRTESERPVSVSVRTSADDTRGANATSVDATTRTAGASAGSAATTTAEAGANGRESPPRRMDAPAATRRLVKRRRRDSAPPGLSNPGAKTRSDAHAGGLHIASPW